jgi:hypothetical protein
MSDVARWKVHGPVEALRTEFATWDLNQDDWQPVEHFTLTSFRANGTVSTSDTHNPGGSIAIRDGSTTTRAGWQSSTSG